ncbi:MAG: family 16 glycosylhydrolase [Chitinophagaceae bacterium]
MRVVKIISMLLIIASGCSKGGRNSGTETTPTMSFDDVSFAEGTGAVNNIEFKLMLNKASSKQITVTYSTVEGTAKGGADFTVVTNQSVTFQPNEIEKKIIISIVADDLKEPDETFQIRVQNPSNVILLKETGIITLRNDDTKIAFNNTGYDAPTSYTGYILAWSDEFNSTSLDAGAWSAESGDGCPGLCGWGNNELQYYTAPPNNLFFQDGKMFIEARSESYGGKNYTSSRIKTQGKKTFKYGRIDVRAILPKGKGIWPAFWLLPQDNVYGGWPKSGEIDMTELMGSEPSKVLGTLHFGPGPNSTYISRNYSLTGSTFNDQFHVFSLEWKQDQLKWYIDDNLFSTINKADLGSNNYPFNENFYFIINLAVGGNFPGAPDAGTLFPQWLILDYIRVYQN